MRQWEDREGRQRGMPGSAPLPGMPGSGRRSRSRPESPRVPGSKSPAPGSDWGKVGETGEWGSARPGRIQVVGMVLCQVVGKV